MKMFFYKEIYKEIALFPKTPGKLKEISRSEEEPASADIVLPWIREQFIAGRFPTVLNGITVKFR